MTLRTCRTCGALPAIPEWTLCAPCAARERAAGEAEHRRQTEEMAAAYERSAERMETIGRAGFVPQNSIEGRLHAAARRKLLRTLG